MLLQTNSYVVPKDKRNEHARLVRRFRQSLTKLGCEHFEVYEQVSQNWSGQDSGGRYVQIMRFRDRRHQLEVQAAERSDPVAQALIQEFCELINFPFQQQQGLFAVGFYSSVLPPVSSRESETPGEEAAPLVAGAEAADSDSTQAPVEEVPAEPPARRADGRGGLPPNSGPGRRPAVAPIFFDSTVAEPGSPPSGPKLAADELDSGITDLSDSHLMKLDLPPSDSDAPEARLPLESAEPVEPAEAHDVPASIDVAELHSSEEEFEDAAASPDHLEGHDEIEPLAVRESRHGDSIPHPHMRLAQDDINDESNAELFERDEPVSPFGN